MSLFPIVLYPQVSRGQLALTQSISTITTGLDRVKYSHLSITIRSVSRVHTLVRDALDGQKTRDEASYVFLLQKMSSEPQLKWTSQAMELRARLQKAQDTLPLLRSLLTLSPSPLEKC